MKLKWKNQSQGQTREMRHPLTGRRRVTSFDCDCDLSNIGQTKQNISTRVEAHIADVKDRCLKCGNIYR